MQYQYLQNPTSHLPVDSFFHMRNTENETEGKEDLILPDCTPGILWIQKGKFTRTVNSKEQELTEGNIYIFGQKTQVISYRYNSEPFEGVGLKLAPHGLYRLLGIPAHEMTHQVYKFDDILPSALFNEWQLSSCYSDYKQGILHLLTLLSRYQKHTQPELLDVILEEIHHSSGQVSIQEISQKYKIGYKRIERLFRQFVGITPKQYTRLIRFSHCVKYAAQFPRKNLTDIALAHGFFDQMHFIRESKSITGQLPSRIFNNPVVSLEKEHVNYLLSRSY